MFFLRKRARLRKSQQMGLFEAPAHVEGHVRGGQFIAGYESHRKKAPPKVTVKKRRAAAPKPESDAEAKAPEKPGKNQVSAPLPENDPLTDNVIPSPTPGPEVPVPPPSELADVAANTTSTFGVPDDVAPAQRRAWNAEALTLLQTRGDAPLTAEQKTALGRYSGRGGIGDSLNEYYTRLDVAAGIWAAIARLGFPPGEVLEPSCGTGVFMHTAPDGIKVVGNELDPTSATIARLLHVRHELNQSSFENLANQDTRLFAAVVGNPPFGLRGSFLADDKPDIPKAEQYFLDTALDKTQAGGLVALVLPAGILDASSASSFRRRLLCKGQFLGALRLPNTAFEHADTEVTTDVVFFRRRSPDVAQALLTLDEGQLAGLGVLDPEFEQGHYFEGRGAGNILGQMEAGWRAKAGMGDDITVTGSMAGVAAAVAAFEPAAEVPPLSLADVLMALDPWAKARATRAALKAPYEVAQRGDTKTVDGVQYVLAGEPPRWHRMGEDVEPAHVASARQLGQSIEGFTQGQGGAGAIIQALEAWVAQHGNPRSNRDLVQRAAGDKDLHRFMSAVQPDGSFSDLLTGKRQGGEASIEATADRLSLLHGTFTAEQLRQASDGDDAAALEDMLFASDRYALAQVASGDGAMQWQSMDQYLTGELWPKLDVVKAQLKDGKADAAVTAKLELQAQRLEAVIAPKSLEDVEVLVNSGWVPTAALEAFFNAEVDDYLKEHPTSTWLKPISISFDKGAYTVSGGLNRQNLLEKYLNRNGVREDDLSAINTMNRDFKAWLLTSAMRDPVEDLYNRSYTGFVKPAFSDEPMEVPGLNPGFQVNAYHWSGLRWAMQTGKGIIAADVGLGKAQPLDAKILTPTGWVLMGDLKVGDKIIAGDGSPTGVAGIYPQGEKDIFRVIFNDGSATECCDEHLWLTQTQLDRNNQRRMCHDFGVPKARILADIQRTLTYRGGKNHSIPMVGEVQFAAREMPIDPYVLGLLIGDGALGSWTPDFCNPNAEIVAELARRLPPEVRLVLEPNRGSCPSYRIVKAAGQTFAPNPLGRAIKALGLRCSAAHKFVPDCYKFNTPDVRLAMLHGLMDTDGYVSQNGTTVQFTSVSERLAKDVQFLVNSLGGNATIRSKIPTFTYKGEKKKGQRAYTVHLRLPPSVEPFYKSLRRLRVRPKSKYKPVRFITAIEPVGRKLAQCIAVEHPSHLYVTDDFIVTHNTGRALILNKLLKVHGLAKKPAIVVPKSVLANWAAEVNNWFPGARVMIVGESYVTGKDGQIKAVDDDQKTRDQKFHDLAQNDYDFVLLSQPVWNELDLNPVKKGEYAQEDFWAQRADALGKASDKRREKMRVAHDQALAGREFEKRSEVIYFDDLGIDALIMDEAHAYKNLYAARNRFGESPKFLGGSGLSNRALDTQFKAKYVREKNGGKNVFFLTATPTKNSPLEVYSMLAHIAPEAFERMGIRNSEEFLDRFCEFTKDLALGVDGKIEPALITSGFKNLDELREVMKRYIDRTTAEDVGLKLPARDEREHLVDMTSAQQAEYSRLRGQLELGKDTNGDDVHVFSIMDQMGKATLDLSLLGHADQESPKYTELAKQVKAFVPEGGQIVFCDQTRPHEAIRKALVAAGLKPSEIAIANADTAKTSLARQQISDQFNAGKLKAVITNIEEGLNLQKQTTDIHHLDIPWNAATLQQRNGRGLRQGNTKEAVRIHRYIAKGSFDGYRYQTVAAKKDWQDQLWNGGAKLENLSRATVSREDLMILMAADPEQARQAYAANKSAAEQAIAAGKRAEAGAEFVRFRSMTRSHAGLKNKASASAARLHSQIERARERLKASAHFTAPEALTDATAVAMDAQSGVAYRPQTAVRVTVKNHQPFHWADGTHDFVVTGVHNTDGPDEVVLRPIGGSAVVTLEAAKLTPAAQPIAYDADLDAASSAANSLDITPADIQALGLPEADAQALGPKIRGVLVQHGQDDKAWHKTAEGRARTWAKVAEAIRAVAPDADVQPLVDKADMTLALSRHGKAPDQIKSPKDLADLPRAVVEEHAELFQRHLKRLTMAYQDGNQGDYLVVGPDGKVKEVKSYDVRKLLGDHRLLLPTAVDAAAVKEAWKAAQLARTYGRRTVQTSHQRKHYQPGRQLGGATVHYGSHYENKHNNPLASGKNIVGEAVFAEAAAELAVEQQAKAGAASFTDAVAALLPVTDMAPYGGYAKWKPEHLRLLADKAEQQGIMGQRLVNSGGSVYTSNLPSGVPKGVFDAENSGSPDPLGDYTTVAGALMRQARADPELFTRLSAFAQRVESRGY